MACGGRGGSPEVPDEVPPSGARESPAGTSGGESEAGGEPAGASSTSPEAEGQRAPDEAADVSSEDLTKILQLVLDDEELSAFLKLSEPGRFPLKLAGKDLPSGVAKGGKPVEIVDGPKSEKDAVLVITKLEIAGSTATVAYRYDVEGIRGTSRVTRGPSGWELKSSRIVER
jgi:hypothetical protein